MAQYFDFLDGATSSVIVIRSEGSDKLENNSLVVVSGIVLFLVLNIIGLVVLGVILASTSHEETLRIDKPRQTLNFRRTTAIAGINVSSTELECRIDELDLYTEDISSENVRFTLILHPPRQKKYVLKITLDRSVKKERDILTFLMDYINRVKLQAMQTARQLEPAGTSPSTYRIVPDAYAPNISITDDELVYTRTMVTSKDYWGMYWSFVIAVLLIVGGVTILLFAVFPLIRTQPKLFLVHVPLGLLAVGIIFRGLYTIMFKLIATKTREIVRFHKLSQVVTLEDHFVTSKSQKKYLFEQVNLKLEKLQTGGIGGLQQSHAVVLLFETANSNPRKVELVKTGQYHQAVALYNSIAEVLYRPTLAVDMGGG